MCLKYRKHRSLGIVFWKLNVEYILGNWKQILRFHLSFKLSFPSAFVYKNEEIWFYPKSFRSSFTNRSINFTVFNNNFRREGEVLKSCSFVHFISYISYREVSELRFCFTFYLTLQQTLMINFKYNNHQPRFTNIVRSNYI